MGISTGYRKQHSAWGLILAGALGLVLGLLIAWVIAPVRWVDTDPVDLRLAHQQDYVQMVADSYALNGDVSLAQERLQQLSPDGVDLAPVAALVAQVSTERQAQGDEATVARLERLTNDTGLAQWSGAQAAAPTQVPAAEAPAQAAAPEPLPSWVLLLFAIGVLIVVFAAIAGLMLARQNKRAAAEPEFPVFDAGLTPLAEEEAPASTASAQPTATPQRPSLEEILGIDTATTRSFAPPPTSEEPLPDVGALDLPPAAQAAPPAFPLDQASQPTVAAPTISPAPSGGALAEFDVIYHFGDDDFYHSVAIDSPEESFIGQCGIVISDVVSTAGPQQVTAFDVWLFETRGPRTVSQVLLSPWAATEQSTAARLSRKGALITATPGGSLSLETPSLRLTADITDVSFHPSEQYPNGIFEHLALHMRVDGLPA
ncbi:MAG: hypothetical protein ABFD20_11415 [Anaerolineales bacterium]